MRYSTEPGAALRLPHDKEPPAALRARLDRLAAGDRDALAELYAAYGDLVFGTALRLTRTRADAEDVTQELFLRLAAAVTGFTGDAAAFPGWLRRVAARQALMQIRGGRRRREVSVEGLAGLLAPSVHQTDRLTIEAALAHLSDEHRTVFLLKEVEGYAHGEIAELLGISVSNSEIRLHRARRSLRELLRGAR
jgi:RNA polymerase sigma-70 factor (ECF subfamily)